MTQTVQGKAAEKAVAERDVQRESLEQLVKLSIECTSAEQRIEQQHDEALELENGTYNSKAAAIKQEYKRRAAEIVAKVADKQKAIENKYDADRAAIESNHEAAQQQIVRKRKEADSAIRKQVEQAAWQAESVLVTFQMGVDQEEQKAKQEEEASKAELAGLANVDMGAKRILARYRMEVPAVQGKISDEAQEKIDADRKAALEAYKGEMATLVSKLDKLTESSVMEDFMPWVIILMLGAVAGGAGWLMVHDEKQRLWAAGGAGGGIMLIGLVLFLTFRFKKRKRVKAMAAGVYGEFRNVLAAANEAARFDAEAAARERERKVSEARKKRDGEVNVAKETARAQQLQAAEEYRSTLAEATLKYKDSMAAVETEKAKGVEDLAAYKDRKNRELEEATANARSETESRHTSAATAIETEYQRECAALEARWNDGLKAVTELIAVGSGIDPNLIDWNNPAWDQWKSPAEFSGRVRFGEMKVDLAQLTEQVPKRLKLPEKFSVPAMLRMPAHGSLLIETDHAGRTASVEAARMVMARLLTQMPAGRVKFTIFDPVGLGQSFAGFMHLADHDESLVASRIWTEKEHMQQRLADLTEHMETVIQKYLRNEYATIDQYNAQAGELAEPIRYLVIADFPTGFEQETLRRLASIALSGPRCGVYTIILRDMRQTLPAGSRIEDISAQSVKLQHKNGAFIWDDAVFKRFPLSIDASPDEKTLTRLMDQVGKAAKDAKRVEVPFESIAPRNGEFWSMSSQYELRVPIGKSGATRLQSLKLGTGVAQHTLVAGKTGSGKSNLMHTIVTNLAMWYGPDEVEFYLVDFKKGVEFKAYASSGLPHARAIAVESDREFGLSVLQRVDAELTRRGALFRDAGVQEIGGYRERTGQKLPRTILLIDEFQEFFSEEDKLAQEAAGLLDRLVRQGRAFGVHLVLGSQTIGGTSGLGRSTLGQIAVRVALQCTEADSQLILGDNNSAARLLSRPGEAIYNDAGGLVEANSPFQIAFLPDEQREQFLERVHDVSKTRAVSTPAPIVFEGNTAAAIRKNSRLMQTLERTDYPPTPSRVPGYVGEPVAIKEPTAIPFRRQSGVNVLMVGQQEESAAAIFSSIALSIAAQQRPGEALFYLMDGTPTDSRFYGLLERLMKALPHESRIVGWRETGDAINEIAGILKQRREGDAQSGPGVYVMIFGLQRYRLLRKQEDDFSFGKDEGNAPKPEKQFAELLSEGPAVGIHNILWADTPITIERTLERSSTRQFDNRILFQMSANDSSNLIDSPLANRLGAHRALLYSEEQGTFEKFRPYEIPTEEWLAFISQRLRGRTA